MLKLPLEYNRKGSRYKQIKRTEFNFNNPKKKDVTLYEQHYIKAYDKDNKLQERLIAYEVFKIQKYPAAKMVREGVTFEVEARESCPYDELWGRDGWTFTIEELPLAEKKYAELVELAQKVEEEVIEEVVPPEEEEEEDGEEKPSK